MNFPSSFPILSTERLQLRCLSPEDADLLFELRTNEKVNFYIDRKPPGKVTDVIQFIENIMENCRNRKLLYWAICMKQSGKLIGTICLWNISADGKIAETGFELFPDYHRKGYMTECIHALSDFAFRELWLHELEAWTNPANVASKNLVEKTGFKFIRRENEMLVYRKSRTIF
jgi:[ribosomal protein S5]-alanine N-acetyltransferase